MSTTDRYSKPQIVLHWLIALIIIFEWVSGDGMGRVFRARMDSGTIGLEGGTPHVWLGSIVFVLILIRIVLRWVQGAPGALPGSSALMTKAAEWGHRVLYALMIAAPALGALAWYGGVNAASELRETVANALMIVALGHAVIAIWHQFIKRDGALNRMRLSAGR
ncbi:cytochrome b [Ruegeria lacuscaerulensis]|uniref:cytochrome b n=1 Tax=Ruegeria lacuscaerulensis TaxID=55218 RepID=UPI00147B381A|nr:cytochrome b/b6 domain-containing protein [Ruegeria lacuscaerulensis]